MDVLVVDDEPLMVTLICDILAHAGYTTSQADNGHDALAYLKGASTLPCLIVMDIMMPRMLGWEFRQYQLQDPRLAGIPLVLMGGGPGFAARATSLGADFLAKPFSDAELLALVGNACGPRP